ncbi:unnamed protein product [Brassicogethes aeneus]|uniref:Dynein axonemal intermediate chain 4 n=1 Tax=Brassicogethes aeneus TaxID=1431903 RepID=A0A9P0B4F9_BRAAE|nr:unnamed protein product [Brassicogethes aeneus]
MFSVKHSECIGFESKWKVVKVSSEAGMQTSEFQVDTKGTSTVENKGISIQTDSTACQSKEVDMQKVADWLNRIYPNVAKELNEANNSKAFKGYCLSSDSKDFSLKHLQTIERNVVTEKGDSNDTISSMSWNSTGKILSVSYAHPHKGWCHHNGCIYIYKFKNGILAENKKISTDFCVTNIKFHATYPSIIVAGTYTGSINIWDLHREDNEMLVASINGHNENITQLSWIPDIISTKNYLLASSSIDGFLKVWTYDYTTSNLAIKSNYKFKLPIFGNIKRDTPTPKEISQKVWRGVVAFDFSKFLSDIFLVALEGGLIVECAMSAATEIKGGSEESPLSDPVVKYYESQESEISAVSFSPNRKEMFMTLGTDCDVRVYVLDQEDPAQIIYTKEPLLATTWIPYEDKLIAGCGKNGMLEIFNVQKAKLIENINSDKVSKTALSKIAVNKDNSNIVALGSINGQIQLWNVPWNSIAFNN